MEFDAIEFIFHKLNWVIYIDRVMRKTVEGLDAKEYGIKARYTMPDMISDLNTLNQDVVYILELFYTEDLVLICKS